MREAVLRCGLRGLKTLCYAVVACPGLKTRKLVEIEEVKGSSQWRVTTVLAPQQLLRLVLQRFLPQILQVQGVLVQPQCLHERRGSSVPNAAGQYCPATSEFGTAIVPQCVALPVRWLCLLCCRGPALKGTQGHIALTAGELTAGLLE